MRPLWLIYARKEYLTSASANSLSCRGRRTGCPDKSGLRRCRYVAHTFAACLTIISSELRSAFREGLADPLNKDTRHRILARCGQGRRYLNVGQARGNKVHSFSLCGINALGRRSTAAGVTIIGLGRSSDRPTSRPSKDSTESGLLYLAQPPPSSHS